MSRSPNLKRAAFSQGSKLIRVRRSAGARVGHRWVETPREDVFIRMAPRPVSPSDRQLLPEGMRTEDTLSILTAAATPLKVESSASNGGAGPDRIFYQGVWWRVFGEKPWAENGFRRYIAIREPAPMEVPT